MRCVEVEWGLLEMILADVVGLVFTQDLEALDRRPWLLIPDLMLEPRSAENRNFLCERWIDKPC